MRGRLELGDGDNCPINPAHGRMYFIAGSDRQWCAHNDHDGRSKNHPKGPAPMTRSLWPQGDDALRRAIITETLPEIDIRLLGG
jgi:hypothetical protein